MSDLTSLVNRARAREIVMQPNLARNLRNAAGLTQQEVASLIGVTNASVSLWESGSRVPSKEVAERYLNILVAAVDPTGKQNLLAELHRLIPRDPYDLIGLQAAREARQEVQSNQQGNRR